jgi:hypothetical protein
VKERVMKKNMGNMDRSIRVALAVAVGVLFLTGQITGTAAIIAGVVAAVFLLTSAAGFCPLYAMLDVSTMKKH